MVGVAGVEPATFCPPDRRPSTELHPVVWLREPVSLFQVASYHGFSNQLREPESNRRGLGYEPELRANTLPAVAREGIEPPTPSSSAKRSTN